VKTPSLVVKALLCSACCLQPPTARAVEQGLREQMQVLQRKLLRAVTENESLRHAVDKLQEDVLTLHRQLLQAGMLPHVQLDSSFLSPLAHEVSVVPLLTSAMGRRDVA
jgi:hypothetical protein